MTTIPIYLVTGFLGAGKTTFLRKIFERTRKFEYNALILNDFGDVQLESSTFTSEWLEIFEIAGGCLCCSSIDDFKTALKEIYQRKPSKIFIEATGLSDTLQILHDLAFMGFPVECVFCVVDANSLKYEYFHQTWKTQLQYANVLLISKLDELNARESQEELFTYLQSQNANAKIIELQNGNISSDDFGLLFAQHPKVSTDNKQLSLFTQDWNVIECSWSGAISRVNVDNMWKIIPKSVWRSKGIIAIYRNTKKITENYFYNYVSGKVSSIPITALHSEPRQSIDVTSRLTMFTQGGSIDELRERWHFLPNVSFKNALHHSHLHNSDHKEV